jgi:trehalose/maltose hydrolase-like predicted phosphorylase
LFSELVIANAQTPKTAPTDPAWLLHSDRFDNAFERQAFTGNGYIGIRVPAAGMGYVGDLGKVGWPLGTERITSSIAASVFAKTADGSFYKEAKEAIALIPTWSTLTFGDSSGLYSPSVSASTIEEYKQSLALSTGVVTTSGTWTSPGGKKTRFVYRVTTDRARSHVAAVELELTPLWTGEAMVNSVLDGAGARRVEPVSVGVDLASQTVHVASKAIGTGILVAESATLQSSCASVPAEGVAATSEQTAIEQVTFQAQAGKTCTFVKYVGVVSGRDSTSPEVDALKESQQAAGRGLAALEEENRDAWGEIWNAGIEVEGDPALQAAIRASEFDLFASVAPNTPGSLGPSGLSSDGYAGTVFWDADTWMFPALLAQHPRLAKVLVDYRSDTLPGAQKNASDNGYKGALYPWTSAIAGDMGDECYGAVTDAKGKIIADPNKSCTQQFHLQSDVALAQWQYYEATGDKQWLAERGWPVIEAVAQFWAGKVTPVAGGGFAINQIQTPDEYATDTNNDAYTNAEAAQELQVASKVASILGKAVPAQWEQIASGLIRTIPVDTKHDIYLEHDGYTGQQIKQADVVMLTYPLNFSMPKSYGINDLNYYTPITDRNGPAMTDAIHSIAAAALNGPGCSGYTYTLRSYQPFLREPYLQFSEFAPIKLTATAYDFMTGVGGFMQEFLFGYSGLRFQVDGVAVDPSLPPQMAGVKLRNLKWQGRTFTMHIGPRQTTITLESGEPLPVLTPGGKRALSRGNTLSVPTRRSDLQPTDNLARCRTITATSSAPGSPPEAAVDGSPATVWDADAPAADLTVDLGAEIVIGKITVLRGGKEPFSYTVESSTDGMNFKQIATTPAISSGTDSIEVRPVEARYVRLRCEGGDTVRPSVAELSVTASKSK